MNFKKFLIGGATSAIMFGAMIAPTFAAGPTCSVPGTYPTIQDAVNDPGCTTINVAAGTYAESVAINHALILNGPNVGASGNSARVPEAVVNDINITASAVIVDGFSFTNPGVQMNINGATTLSGVKVQNNIFSGYSSVGIPTYNAGNLLITKNLFKSPLADTEAMQIKADGTTLGGCNGTVVSDNVFTAATNNGGAEINFSCTGSGSTGVTVSGNTDTGLAGAGNPSFTAFSGVVGGIVVTDNTVTGTPTAGSAIWFWGGVTGTVDINNNVITNFGVGNGIDVGNALDGNNTGAFTFTHNDLSGNFRSIRLRNAFDSGATVTANRNNVSGNSTGVGILNDSTLPLVANATCNWWGAVNGPGPVGSGSGNNVSTNVTFTPWLTSSDLNGPCNGPLVGPPTKFSQCKGDGWKTFNNPTFTSKSKCEKYVKENMHTIKGNDVIYTAGGLKREADLNMSTAEDGSFEYDDAAKGWYNVKVSSVKVDGNHGWFAGRVVKASNPSWVGLWLFGKVEDNGPDKIWGSFTDQPTAEAGVQNTSDPADGPFNVTKKDIKVN